MIRRMMLSTAAVLALAAVGAHAQPGPGYGPPPQGVQAGDARTDALITMASQSDEYEIRAGRLAMRLGVSPRVREFGRMMVRDHTRTTRQLQGAIARSGMRIPPPPPLREDQRQMLDALATSRGREFDRLYADQQVRAHNDALSLMQGYAKDGQNPFVREAAVRTIPIIEHHLGVARDMRNALRIR